MLKFDVVVIGAGAAGMMCAAKAGQGGKRVALFDHSEKLAEKIRISGGGRCNFTNRAVSPVNFVSQNPGYAQSALSLYTPQHFLELVKAHGIAYHEKHKGQLFCDRSSEDIIRMLASECEQGRVTWFRPQVVHTLAHALGVFNLDTSVGQVQAPQVVVATGGLPIPKIGASDFGLKIARQFGHSVVETRPALVPLTFDAQTWAPWVGLAGVSAPVWSQGSDPASPWFDESLLFTHRGLSGPAVLQVSSFWLPGQPIALNFSQHANPALFQEALAANATGTRALVDNWLLAQLPHLPKRLVAAWLETPVLAAFKGRKVAELGKKQLHILASAFALWRLVPSGTEGYKKAEVMRGGVSTTELDPATMGSRRVPGLYFVGEVVDVTGWLGGYNFQWAWASGFAAARAILAAGT